MAVYLVIVQTIPPTERLVEAPNMASARNHVARQFIRPTVAKQSDLFRIAKAGGDIETAGEHTLVEPEATNDDDDTTVAADDTATDGVKRTVGEPYRSSTHRRTPDQRPG